MVLIVQAPSFCQLLGNAEESVVVIEWLLFHGGYFVVVIPWLLFPGCDFVVVIISWWLLFPGYYFIVVISCLVSFVRPKFCQATN